ncbi:MAG: TonB-dependent receptor [Saprospiraceae bacterium]|nr:TonB-dependent receptor [Saprospiraceae bacterium]
MRLVILFSALLCLILNGLHAQKISGKITDENNAPLEYASVLFLHAKDSTMVEFTNSTRKGEFTIVGIDADDYLVQITFLGYETVWKEVKLKETDVDLGTIQLHPNAKVMDAIEIKDYISPMSFGKDTLQYNAAAFKVKPGDMAEDLLRKLPGMEVQRDGSVKALGETVQNVFVDGKEFFGKDTKIATKNLDADAIDKVQVFDRKSDRAEFTGIEDGQKERSINLKLKDDKKIGYFGTAEAAGGTKERFKGRANINRFTPNLRTSFIGMANNINEQNFSINDYIDFMGGIGALMSGGGGRFMVNLDQDSGLPIGLENNQGIQKSFAGGFNINTDFSKKISLEGSVFGNHFKNDLHRNATRENLLPDSRFITESSDNQISDNSSASFTLRLKTKPDSTQNLIVKSNGSFGTNNLISDAISNAYYPDQLRINDNANTFDMSGDNFRITTDVLWQKKTNKPGRTYSINGVLNLSDNKSDSDVASLNNIYFPHSQTDRLLQNQLGSNHGLYYKAEVSYTEPIGKKQYLQFKTTLANQNNRTSTDYFDIVNENFVRNQFLSTLYQRDYTQRNLGLNYSLSREKYNFTLGTGYKYSTLDGIINNDENKIVNHFQAVLPNAFFNYRFGMSENLNFNYFSEMNEPSLNQLQPVINNSNPLAIYVGNPNLKPEQWHNSTLSYMKYDAFNFTMFYASLQTNYTHNKITESLTIDSSLARIYTPVNIKNESTTSGRLEYDTPVRPLKIKAKMILRGNYNQGISVINEQNNQTRRLGYGYNFSLENRNKDVVDLLVGYKTNRSESRFAQNESLNQSYTEKTFYIESGINIKDWVSLKSNFDYLTIKPSFATNNTVIPVWTMSITSFVTRDKKLRAILSCFDILDKNKGITANSQLNYTDITRTNVLGRYVMLGFSYNIKGFQKKSGMEINIKAD